MWSHGIRPFANATSGNAGPKSPATDQSGASLCGWSRMDSHITSTSSVTRELGMLGQACPASCAEGTVCGPRRTSPVNVWRPSQFRNTVLFMETINGVPVTEEMIQAWVEEAERGYDLEALRKRGRKPKGDGPARVVPVRLDDTLVGALDARAEEEHTSRSDVIRAAIRAYVA